MTSRVTQCRKNPSGNECPKGLSSGLSKLHNKNVKDVVSIFVRWVRCKHNSIVIGVIDVWYNTTINISRCSHMCNDCHIMKAVKRIFFFVFLLQDLSKIPFECSTDLPISVNIRLNRLKPFPMQILLHRVA